MKCFLYSVILALSIFALGRSQADDPSPSTWCNPLSIPNYPIGRFARDLSGTDTGPEWMWRLGYKQQFRELADVTALWHDGKWFLYPSVDMAWVSEDLGATWKHHPLNVRDAGYAPTIVKHRNRFLLMASNSPIYASESPLGPFEELGRIELQRSGTLPDFVDPMLFSDSDDRLFYYWGCTPAGGIWGVELNAADPTQVIGTPSELIPFDSAKFPWEAVGAWNQNPRTGWMEGAWMLKRNGKYYLTYSAGGTENRSYAMGAYVGDSPLGPFTPQNRNPILRTVDGLITGTAHGSIVAGPNDELWAFYSVRAAVVHAFERRLGMDRADIDENGELYVREATSLPQHLPQRLPNGTVSPAAAHSTGWLPMNGELRTIGSTNAPNLEGRFAVDNDLCTWWQPSTEDQQPTLTTDFLLPSTIHAVRIIWRDVGLNTQQGADAGPMRYRVELETRRDQWTTVIDRSRNDDDLLIDYRESPPTTAIRARLVILETPAGITPAVSEFTVFGRTN
ncbi:MAG: family 43 glycosylhydrolase [Planctomyces sp.]|nr:family 43 glycosylhydrolase [Planctomyces sp.]